MRYSTYLIDADGTLFDYDRAEASAIRDAFAAFGWTLADGEIHRYRAINDEAWDMHERGAMGIDEMCAWRGARFLQPLGFEADVDRFTKVYIDFLSGYGLLLPGALELCRGLKAGGARIAIVTNGFTQVQNRRLASSDIREYVDALIVSQEVGAAKPDPLPLRRALEALGCEDRAQAVMVGDSLTADVAGARAAGIDQCWVNAMGAAVPVPGPTHVVHHLLEVLNL